MTQSLIHLILMNVSQSVLSLVVTKIVLKSSQLNMKRKRIIMSFSQLVVGKKTQTAHRPIVSLLCRVKLKLIF